MNKLFALPALALISSCATVPSGAAPAPEGSLVALGKPVTVGALVATPVKVIEDSRCPENARCVWAGRLTVSTLLEGNDWHETVPLTLGDPHGTHGTIVTLVSGVPEKQAGKETPAETYRFGYEGGGKPPV